MMYCPRCGSTNPDNSAFCGHCGYKFEKPAEPLEAQSASFAPESQTPSEAYDSLGTDYQTPATTGTPPTKKSNKPKIMAIIIVVVLVAGIGAFAALDPLRIMPWNAGAKGAGATASQQAQSGDASTQTTTDAQTTAEGSELGYETTDSTDVAITEEAPNRIDPKEKIELKDIQIEKDAFNRYVVTGTVTNGGSDTYDVTLGFGATRHTTDKYGEETTDPISMDISSNMVPYTNDDVTYFDLKPNESRPLQAYVRDSVDDGAGEFLSDPVVAVKDLALASARTDWRFDYDGGIEVSEPKLTADGKVVMNYKNNTGMYLNKFTATFFLYTKSGDELVFPADKEMIKSGECGPLMPGDAGTFEVKVGEGYASVKRVSIDITPDQTKNTFQ